MGPGMLRRTLLGTLVAGAAGAASAAPKAYRAPRTAYGAPQLEGLWTAATYTELQRPDAFKALITTPEAARAWEAKLAKTGGVNVPSDPLGQAQSEFPETGAGLSRIRGEIRTSHIVDPPDGQIPWSAAAKKDLHIGERGWRTYDDPEARPHNERCLAAASTGAPILSSEDANVLQILQTRDHVAILTEKYHDVRIIRLPGAPAMRGPRSWLGESVGRWEGETLLVATDGFPPGVIEHGDDLYLSGQSRVEERFTRIADGEIFYAFRVSDPYLFSRPWRGELVFKTSAGAIFEYACHEGNYSLTNILAAARLGRQPAPKAAAAAP
jgi:hypothetical protein